MIGDQILNETADTFPIKNGLPFICWSILGFSREWKIID
jgi:hypothetical protein